MAKNGRITHAYIQAFDTRMYESMTVNESTIRSWIERLAPSREGQGNLFNLLYCLELQNGAEDMRVLIFRIKSQIQMYFRAKV